MNYSHAVIAQIGFKATGYGHSFINRFKGSTEAARRITMTVRKPKHHLTQANCDPQIADSLIRLVVATGNKAKVSEPLMKASEAKVTIKKKESVSIP